MKAAREIRTAEENCYAMMKQAPRAAGLKPNSPRRTRGGSMSRMITSFIMRENHVKACLEENDDAVVMDLGRNLLWLP